MKCMVKKKNEVQPNCCTGECDCCQNNNINTKKKSGKTKKTGGVKK